MTQYQKSYHHWPLQQININITHYYPHLLSNPILRSFCAEGFLVVRLEFCAKGRPFVLTQLRLLCSLQHRPAFFDEPLFIGPCLPNKLIAIQTKHKLWLCLDEIVLGDLGSDITVYINYLKIAVVGGDFVDVLISNLAVWIPLSREVDYHEGEPIARQVVVHQVELGKAL